MITHAALQNILEGNEPVKFGETIVSTLDKLIREKETIYTSPEQSKRKANEKKVIERMDFWYKGISEDNFIGCGSEQRVYADMDPNFVLKLNTGIYYDSWSGYLRSLLIHNYFFPHLAYELLGFTYHESNLCSVVRQHYVVANEFTDTKNVKTFLLANGFRHTRNHDYFHLELKLILEDLHDENVLTNNGVLQFIDTVFYFKY